MNSSATIKLFLPHGDAKRLEEVQALVAKSDRA